MKYNRVGRTGLKISNVALGSWLTFGKTVDQATCNEIVKAAFSAGINFIDTADVYSMGSSESALGEALKGVRRKGYVLGTKVFWPTGEGPNDKGCSRKHLMETIDESLERLKTRYVDLYSCHRFDPDSDLRETVHAMEDIVRSGRALYWGVSVWTGQQMRDAMKIAREIGGYGPVCNQPQYNMLERSIELDPLPASIELGIGNTVWSPLGQGMLTGKYKSREDVVKGTRRAEEGANRFLLEFMTPENFKVVEQLKPIAQEVGCTMAQLALAWCLKRPGITSVIIGATRVQQVVENAKAGDIELGDAVWARLEKLVPKARPAAV